MLPSVQRTIPVNVILVDQFSVYGVVPAKISGLVQPADFTILVWKDGVLQVSPPTITIVEISGPSGEYKLSFTPNALGQWKIEIVNTGNPTDVATFIYQVALTSALGGVLTGQTYYDVVTDTFGNKLPNVTVNVYATGTSTLLATTTTDALGQFNLPLTGALSQPILVDIETIGSGLFTQRKVGVRLF